jgi:AbiV family abortive infection protein
MTVSTYPPLPPRDDLEALIRAALANAKDLLNDAVLLVNSGSFPRALALATLSWEELSKADLCALAMVLPEITAEQFWSHFRDHEGKLIRVHALAGFMRPEPIGPISGYAKKIRGRSRSTQDLKERGLYIDYRQGKVLLPSQVTESAARKQIKNVREALAIADAAFSGESIEIMFTQLNPLLDPLRNAAVSQPEDVATALQEAIQGGSQEKLQVLIEDHRTNNHSDG